MKTAWEGKPKSLICQHARGWCGARGSQNTTRSITWGWKPEKLRAGPFGGVFSLDFPVYRTARTVLKDSEANKGMAQPSTASLWTLSPKNQQSRIFMLYG